MKRELESPEILLGKVIKKVIQLPEDGAIIFEFTDGTATKVDLVGPESLALIKVTDLAKEIKFLT